MAWPTTQIVTTNIDAGTDSPATARAQIKEAVDSLNLLPLGSGSAAIGHTGAGTGAVLRTLQSKLRDLPSIKDFGAKGDAATNDTAAVNVTLSYMAVSGQSVYVPPGIYLVDPIIINSQTYAGQANFIGDERERTVFQRRATGAGAFVTIGASNGTVFQSGIGFCGITLDGGAITNGDTLACYDLVRTSFRDMRFKGGACAVHLYGGISLTFDDCLFDGAKRGIQIEKFTSAAGGGWPNLIRVNGGEIADNTEWGVWFNDGRMLILRGVDIEGNGTTTGAAQGGVYVGGGVGAEVTANDTFSHGLIVDSCWLESNIGIADIQLSSGINGVYNSNFFSISATNDIKIDGGKYTLKNLNCSFSKAANILEGVSTQAGNIIEKVEAANISYSAMKTAYFNGDFLRMRGGAVPGIVGMTAPLIQVGSDSSGVNPTITFPTAFKAGTTPTIFLSVVNNSAGTLDAPEYYSNSSTGFVMRKKSHNGTVITTANYTVSWVAVGEAP